MKRKKALTNRLITFLLVSFLCVSGLLALGAVRSYKKMNREVDQDMQDRLDKYALMTGISGTTRDHDYDLNYLAENSIWEKYTYPKDISIIPKATYGRRSGVIQLQLLENEDGEIVDMGEIVEEGDAIILGGSSVVNSSLVSVMYDTDGDILYTSGNRPSYIPRHILYFEHFADYTGDGASLAGMVIGTDANANEIQKFKDLAAEIKRMEKTTGRIDGYKYLVAPSEKKMFTEDSTIVMMGQDIMFYDDSEEVSSWRSGVLTNAAFAVGIYILIAVVAIVQYSKTKKALSRDDEKEMKLEQKTDTMKQRFQDANLLSMVDNAEQSTRPCEEMNQLRQMIEDIQKDRSEVQDEE